MRSAILQSLGQDGEAEQAMARARELGYDG